MKYCTISKHNDGKYELRTEHGLAISSLASIKKVWHKDRWVLACWTEHQDLIACFDVEKIYGIENTQDYA